MSITGVNGFSCPPKKKQKKRGRPKLRPEERVSVRRKLVLRPREAKLLDSLAKKAGKSFNLWAREVLLAAAGE
jgi:hypothetical protein